MELITKASFSAEINKREIDNLEVAYNAACESIVLLKNDGVLPLKNNKIAAFGPGVTKTIKGGTGSGEVNERHSISIFEGLVDCGFEVSTKKWLEEYNHFFAYKETEFKKKRLLRLNLLKKDSLMKFIWGNFQLPHKGVEEEDILTSDTDTCIYVLSRQAGEGRDRRLEEGDYLISKEEIATIRLCAKSYQHFVLIINSGAGVDLSSLDDVEGINGILYICQLGTRGGHAVADILKGKVTPSGKLTDTWAKSYSHIPCAMDFSYLNKNVKEEYYKEGIYVGYRYFDSFQVEPRYPFGFGLSYTDFSIEPIEIINNKTKILTRVKVINTGTMYSGKEICQLYVSAPTGKLHKEFQALASFGKTKELKPGEEEILTLEFDIKDMASYKEADATFILEAGNYILRLGNSSRNTSIVGMVHLMEECIVSKHENICPVKDKLEELQSVGFEESIPQSIPCLEIEPKDVETIVFAYQEHDEFDNERVINFVDSLSLKEQAEIVVGIGMFGGKTRFTLPGAVGNTTSKFWDKGLANVTLCDGPAGLRIQKMTTVERNGKTKPVELVMSIYEAFPKFIQRFMLGNPNKRPMVYQYTTAFPVAAALAQTWNEKLLYQVGEGIFREMKEYGCTYWLAPAVNIHRNPLCGRNFEYYSEDPRLTGVLAAALTKGVQKEEGYYVTVKHFACNNQEDNRNHMSANLSERALREIYLKAFEPVVKQGHAKGIMTSYNKVNGVYTPNSYDLCTKVLRNEWKFEGVVMTDWYSTGATKANEALAMKAGNDLIMPGGIFEKCRILRGVRKKQISKIHVRKCCYNVVNAIFNSSIQKEYIG